ncbi:hypothetical protein LguiB_013605 [Lonicera macranthoides]
MGSKSSVASFPIYCILCLIFLIILFASPGIAGQNLPTCPTGSEVIGCKPPIKGIP